MSTAGRLAGASRRRVVVVAAVAVSLLACDGSSRFPTTPRDAVDWLGLRVQVSPRRDTIAIGERRQLATAGIGNVRAAFASSDTTIAVVSRSGLVTGRSAGTVRITASALGTTDAATITVAPPADDVIAQHDFDDGTLGPFTSLPSPDLDLPDDPTASGRGRVVRFRYQRLPSEAPGHNVDRNRAFALELLDGDHITFGERIRFEGDVMVPTTHGFGDGKVVARKLLYWQPRTMGEGSGPTMWAVLVAFGEGLRMDIGRVNADSTATYYIDDLGPLLQPHRWHRVALEIVVNSAPDADDGVVRVWWDGVQLLDRRDVRFSDPAWTAFTGWDGVSRAWDWTYFGFAYFLVGDQVNFDEAYDEFRYWDAVVFRR